MEKTVTLFMVLWFLFGRGRGEEEEEEEWKDNMSGARLIRDRDLAQKVNFTVDDYAMQLSWCYVYGICLLLSGLLAGFAAYRLHKAGGDILRSTVRFVIWNFFMATSFHAFACALFYFSFILYMHKLNNPFKELVQDDQKDDGHEAALISKILQENHTFSFPMAFALVLENIFLLLSAYWILLTTSELFHLALTTIRKYTIGAIGIIVLSIVAAITIFFTHSGYKSAYRFLFLTELVSIICSIVYSSYALWKLKVKGRKLEHVHGMLMASPLYRRIKMLLIICGIFTLPYCILQIVLLLLEDEDVDTIPDYLVGALTSLYYLFGAAQAVIMGSSQECCFRLLIPCMPANIRNAPEYSHLRLRSRQLFASMSTGTGSPLWGEQAPSSNFHVVEPPQGYPIFVNTDIESSSALWAQAPKEVMDLAQTLHDDLLRSLLPKHQGYEITTCGDAFQLAFHRIEDAVAYCLAVQLELMNVKWPSTLDGLLPACSTQKNLISMGKKSIFFKGLRVRMGIHDANEEEGVVISHIHPVTGKTYYIGASELVGREVGDRGYGGQILVSQRIAKWLQTHPTQMAIPFLLDYFGPLQIDVLDIRVELYEITPKPLENRVKFFRKRRQEEKEEKEEKEIEEKKIEIQSENTSCSGTICSADKNNSLTSEDGLQLQTTTQFLLHQTPSGGYRQFTTHQQIEEAFSIATTTINTTIDTTTTTTSSSRTIDSIKIPPPTRYV
jgi:class 3 adenylate cyclase